jgi:RHS repeat-associated protein
MDQRGTTSYVYDSMNRLKTNTYPDGNAINYGYDATGKLAALLSSLTGTVTYSYYINGRLKEVTDPQGKITSYTYDAAGSRTGLAYPNGTTVSYVYDDNNRLTNLSHKNAMSEVFASYAYTLGAIGNRTRIDEVSGISRQYQYDRLYRLMQEKVTDPVNTQTYQNDFAYDAVGNRLNKTKAAYSQSVVSNDYTYNNADQLLTESGITYTYDLNGNLATKTDSTGTTTYIYNYDDRLVEVRTPNAATVVYKYDVDNNRVSATTSIGPVKYLVDINRSLSQVLAEYSAVETVIASYVYADDLISMNRNGAVSYYHFDGLGSTRFLSNALGAVTDTYEYDAFGNQIARTGAVRNDFLFTGQQYDANVGSYYLRARYYQPDTGRFTALDPYQGDPYVPHTLHKYHYTNSNPINAIDPTGKFSLGETLATVTLSTIISNIAISMITFNTMAEAKFKIDAILVSGRLDASVYGGAGGGGADVLIDFKTNKVFGSLAGEGGLDPLSVFNKHRGAGLTAVVGLVFGLSNPNQLSGWGVSAFWPMSVMKLMPVIGGSSNIWGMMCQFAKKVKRSEGFSIGFGQSTSGPAMMFFGPSYRMFSSMVSYNSNFIPVEQMLPGAEGYLNQLSNTASALSALGSDLTAFSSNADKALSLLQ